MIRNAAGTIVERVNRFSRPPTAAQALAVSKMTSVPAAYGGTMHAVPSSEHEFMDDKRGRVVRAIGSMLLDTVSTGEQNFLKGSRLGIYLISPTALGGRLALLAKTFEQHKAIKCVISYCPVVPTDTTGALMMYARNDLTAPCVDVGPDELRHAATHPDWMQTSVWKEASMEIKPSNINLRYFDSEEDPADSIQSLLQVECADDVAAHTDFGNLFLHYDFEFYSESLDYDEGQQLTPEVSLVLNAHVLSPGDPVNAGFYTSTAAGTLRWVQDPSSVFPASASQILYGVITQVSGTQISVLSAKDNNPIPLVPGQGFFIATYSFAAGSDNWTDGSIFGQLFTEMPTDDDNGQALVFVTAGGATTGSVRFDMRAVEIADESD